MISAHCITVNFGSQKLSFEKIELTSYWLHSLVINYAITKYVVDILW